MALETGTYISDLNASNPASSDPKSQGDDHLRLIKSTVKTTFPNISGAVTPTHTELNYVAGVTSAIQTQINARARIAGTITAMAALDVDCSAGTYFTKTINGNSTFTFSNAPSGAYGFVLELTHTSGTVTWPAAVKWPGDIAPSLTAGKTHLFVFITDDSGTRWRGSAAVNYTN